VPLGPLLLFGNDQPANPGASVLTLYCANGIVSGANAGTLQTTVPPASTSTTGWTVGTTVAGNYSRQSYNNEVSTAGFGTTVQPSGAPTNSAQDCWRYGPSTGTFSSDTWYSSLSVIGVTSGGDQDGRARFRIWRSSNADGTVATELNGPQVGSLVTDLSTTVAQSSAASLFVPIFALSNEYLFFQAAWEITGVGGAVDRDVLVRYGSISAIDGSGLVTAPFAAAVAGTAVGGGLLNWYYRSVVMDEC
jgi:hypothetical protein